MLIKKVALAVCICVTACTTVTRDPLYVGDQAQGLALDRQGSKEFLKMLLDAKAGKRTFRSAAEEICQWYEARNFIEPRALPRLCGFAIARSADVDAGKVDFITMLKDYATFERSLRSELSLNTTTATVVDSAKVAETVPKLLLLAAIGYVATRNNQPTYFAFQPVTDSIRLMNGVQVACDSFSNQAIYRVDSYVRSDGTVVGAHWKTYPDANLANNLSCRR